MTGDLWVEGSRACQACGSVITDPMREVHEAFHVRVEPVTDLIEVPDDDA